MQEDGYNDDNSGYIYVACALSDLKKVIQEEDDRTPRPVIMF
jgi:hypothetical protein